MTSRRLFLKALALLTVPGRVWADSRPPKQCLDKLHTLERRVRAFRTDYYGNFRLAIYGTKGERIYCRNVRVVSKGYDPLVLTLFFEQLIYKPIMVESVGLVDDQGFELSVIKVSSYSALINGEKFKVTFSLGASL